MKRSKYILSAILMIAILTSRLPVLAGSPENDFNRDTLSENVNSYVNENNENEAAVAVALVSRDEILFEGNYGYADKKAGILADADTVYEWGSLTKVLTWISVMQLYEQGKMDLNEDIRVYLPEGFLQKLAYETPVTMLDLMNHTGGFQDSITNVYTKNPDEIIALGEYVRRYEPVQLYEPGTTVGYSNWGCSLAGYIVECVSGEDYCDYVNTHVFKPLGMEHTSIDPLRRDNSWVSNKLNEITGYTTAGKELSGRFYAPDYPAAGAAGTTSDIALLMQDLLAKEGGGLFTESATYEEFFSTTHTYAGSDKSENCHGLWTDCYQTETAGHFGNTVQFSGHMSLSENYGLIVMTNQAQEMLINEGLGEVVFGSTNPKITPDEDWKELQFQDCYTTARTIAKGYCKFYHFFGLYHVQKTGEDTLKLSSLLMPMPLTRVGETEYLVTEGFTKGYHVYMDVDENGVVEKISMSTMDFVPCSGGMYFYEAASYILIGLVLVLLLALLILWIVKTKKEKKADLITAFMIALSLSYYGVVLVQMINLISTAATRNEMYGYIIFYAGYLVLGLAYPIRNIVKKKWNILTVMTTACYAVIAAFILYWQMIVLWV